MFSASEHDSINVKANIASKYPLHKIEMTDVKKVFLFGVSFLLSASNRILLLEFNFSSKFFFSPQLQMWRVFVYSHTVQKTPPCKCILNWESEMCNNLLNREEDKCLLTVNF